MNAFVDKYGREYTGEVRHDAKGKPFYLTRNLCSRCGGAGGADKWAHTGWTCFDCGGKGDKGMMECKLYSAAEFAKLEARRGKAAATREAKRIAAEAVRAAELAANRDANLAKFEAAHPGLAARLATYPENEFVAKMAAQVATTGELTARQLEASLAAMERCDAKRAKDAANRGSVHVGAIGERVSLTMTVEKVIRIDVQSQFRAVLVITIGRTTDGNVIVYKGSSMAYEGETVTLKATVKDHEERDGVAQTVIQRPKVISVTGADGKVIEQ